MDSETACMTIRSTHLLPRFALAGLRTGRTARPSDGRVAFARAFLSVAIGWGLVLAGGPVRAQTPSAADDDPWAGVEQLIVTGSGVATLVEISNPTSVISFDAADLDAIGAADVSDVAAFTPNLEVKTAASTAATFFIRGVGLADFSANATSSVAVSYDGVAVNSSALQLGQLFDVQNFSVLKGPQSGGAGRNASAGAIRITSRQPGFEHSGNLLVSVGRFITVDAIDAPQYNIEGGFDTPIVPDVLTTRIAFTLKGQDPYITNLCGGLPPILERTTRRNEGLCGETLGADPPGPIPQLPPFGVPANLPTEVGKAFDMGGRAIVKWLPGESAGWIPSDTSITFNLHGRRLRQDSTVGEAIGTGATGLLFGGSTRAGFTSPEVISERNELRNQAPDTFASQLSRNLAQHRPLDKRPFESSYSRIGATRLDAYGGFVRIEVPFEAFEIRSISAMDYYDRWRSTDNDFTPDVLFEGRRNDKAWQVVQDLKVTGELERFPIEWEFGGTYLHENLYNRLRQFVDFPAIVRFTRTYSQFTDSLGAYARASYEFLEAFTLEAGVRYNWEQKTFDILEFGNNPFPQSTDETRTWQAPTGAVSLTYALTEDLEIFWKYSRGFKAGHFNSNEVFGTPASPEQIDAFEIGLSGAAWSQRLRFSAALFNYAYEDYQVFVFQDEFGNPPSLVIRNAQDARVFGADADFTITPLVAYAPEAIENLALTLRFGWLETRFQQFTLLQPRIVESRPTLVVEDNSGNPLINSPRFKVSGTVTWDFIFEGFGVITPRYDFTWTDDAFFDPSEGRGSLNGQSIRGNPKFRTGQPAYALHNVRIQYKTPDESISIAAWCRNVTDTRYKTSAFDVSTFSSVTLNFVGDPRSCGGEMKFAW